MKIVILDGYTENPGDLSWAGFESLGEVTVYDRTPSKQIAERIAGAEVVITNKTSIDRKIIESCKTLRYIGTLSTGVDVIDLEAAKEKGICVCNIPSYGTEAVAQFAMALLLEICNRVGHHSDEVKKGRWSNQPDFCFWDYPLIELAGKTIGVIGFGRIGQTLAKIAVALGMKVLAYDAYPNETGRQLASYVSLDELFAKADVISLHCPLTQETRGFINKETLKKCKDGVIVINNSRGALIVEEDLCRALETGKVYAAGLDVTSTEPIGIDNPLLKAKNCFITPHISWAAKESRARLMETAVDNLKQFVEGTPVNVVRL